MKVEYYGLIIGVIILCIAGIYLGSVTPQAQPPVSQVSSPESPAPLTVKMPSTSADPTEVTVVPTKRIDNLEQPGIIDPSYWATDVAPVEGSIINCDTYYPVIDKGLRADPENPYYYVTLCRRDPLCTFKIDKDSYDQINIGDHLLGLMDNRKNMGGSIVLKKPLIKWNETVLGNGQCMITYKPVEPGVSAEVVALVDTIDAVPAKGTIVSCNKYLSVTDKARTPKNNGNKTDPWTYYVAVCKTVHDEACTLPVDHDSWNAIEKGDYVMGLLKERISATTGYITLEKPIRKFNLANISDNETQNACMVV
jgi:hypothetical protein